MLKRHHCLTLVPVRCFYHIDRDAVGSCKSCGKGLCPDCAVDLGKGLACRGRCEGDVKAVIELIQRNVELSPATSRLIQAGGSARMAAALFMLACGGAFLVFGLSSKRGMSFVAILGACFLAYGAFLLFWSRLVAARTRAKDKSE